jgi:hypothetical protein
MADFQGHVDEIYGIKEQNILYSLTKNFSTIRYQFWCPT